MDRISQPHRFDIYMQLRQPGITNVCSCPATPEPRPIWLNDTAKPRQPPISVCCCASICPALDFKVGNHRLRTSLIFRFQTLNEFGDLEEKRLIVEIMGRHSNIILVNNNTESSMQYPRRRSS